MNHHKFKKNCIEKNNYIKIKIVKKYLLKKKMKFHSNFFYIAMADQIHFVINL